MRAAVKLWKLARIFRDYKRRRPLVRTLPIRLWIETASVCNLRCLMCPNKSMAPAERGCMSFDLFRKIVDEARSFAADVYLHHRGEPLLNPALFDMVAYARAAGLRTRLHTNGTLLNRDRAERLLAAGPDLVSFSVDGFEKTIYERVRVGAVFERTLENILGLLALRRERGLRRPYVVIEKITFKHTAVPEYRERVAELTRRLLESGADVEVVEWQGKPALRATFDYSASPELEELGLMRTAQGNSVTVIVDPATWLPLHSREETQGYVTEVDFVEFDQPRTIEPPVP